MPKKKMTIERVHTDHYCPEPGTCDQALCGFCSTVMTEKRDCFGPTGWAEAMGKHGHAYDQFNCPHREEGWHKKIVALLQQGDEHLCRQVREMYIAEVNQILAANDKPQYIRDLEREEKWDPPSIKLKMFRLQNRYQDGGWEDLDRSYGNAVMAINEAYELCQDSVCYGMVRVLLGDKVVVEFPAGGYE